MNQIMTTMPPYPWQASYWNHFVGLAGGGKTPHAILLAGVPGIGISPLALAMAHYLLCEAPIEGRCCSRCKPCLLNAHSNHPDLFRLSPEEKSAVIKVDQVRALTEFVAKTSQQGGRKLIIIDPAEAMNASAANALLKCLEEPSGETQFILVSLANSRLMPTIRSRCAAHVLGLPPREDAVAWLQQMGVEEPVALLQETQGAPLLAHEWWRNDHLDRRNRMCSELVEVLGGQKPATAIAAQWASRNNALEVTELCIRWLERLIKSRTAGLGPGMLAAWPELVAVHGSVPEVLLFRLLESFTNRKSQLQANPNLNTGMLVEESLLDWFAVVNSARKRKIAPAKS